MNIDKNFLKKIINEVLGVPYSHKGRDIKTGLDCYGILIWFYNRLGYKLDDYDYPANWAKQGKNLFIKNYHLNFTQISPNEANIGDAVLFTMKKDIANHIGVLVGKETFLHAQKHTGAVISKLTQQPCCRKIEAFYRIRDSLKI